MSTRSNRTKRGRTDTESSTPTPTASAEPEKSGRHDTTESEVVTSAKHPKLAYQPVSSDDLASAPKETSTASTKSDVADTDKERSQAAALAKLKSPNINTWREQILSRMPSITLESLAMQPGRDPSKAVNIAVASRALFDIGMDYDWKKEPSKFEEFMAETLKNESEPFAPGSAMPFIQALSKVNRCLLAIDPEDEERFNIILMSHNHAHVGVRLINSVNHHELHIERMCLTGGSTPVPHYLEAYNVSLFLTSYPEEVEKALECGFAAAVMSNTIVKQSSNDQLRVAFDLDAVLFSAESEVHYKKGGLSAFFRHEKANLNTLVDEGPLKKFAKALARMQQKFKEHKELIGCSPIRIYIVTSRSAASSGERAIKTLRAWGLIIDEIHFLAGAPKGPILNAIKPHIFFDDQNVHIESAAEYGVAGAQVPNTIERQQKRDQSAKV